jgi:L-lactate utilization protein LutB
MDNVTEIKEWYKETLAQKVIDALEKNNMTAFYVKTGEEARERVLSMIPVGSKVGYGGSLSLDQIGVKDALRAGNYHLIDRHEPQLSPEEKYDLRKESLLADVFLMSSNAVTMDGKLVNIDGIGNRVAALIFGPSKVIVVAGINKIVPDTEAARQRIKNYVAPIHARRLGLPLPCAEKGKCLDCRSPLRFCNAVVTIEHQYQKDRITVLIVGEDLGL